MNLWDWIVGLFGHKKHPTSITTATGAARYVGGSPALQRTAKVLRVPGTGLVRYDGTASPGVQVSAQITPATGSESVTGEMPYQTLKVRAPGTGRVAFGSAPPGVKRTP